MPKRKPSSRLTVLAATVLYLALMTTTPAKTPPTAKLAQNTAAQQHPCGGRVESHQFDFWIGEWTVRNAKGQQLGTSSISSDLEACVIREAWTGKRGNKGTSVNFYDPASKHWHQIWTDDSGTITHYVGEFRDGAMRFRAEGFGDADGVHHHRTMDFTPNADGSVRQLLRDSDDGTTWTTSFDGIYVRAMK